MRVRWDDTMRDALYVHLGFRICGDPDAGTDAGNAGLVLGVGAIDVGRS